MKFKFTRSDPEPSSNNHHEWTPELKKFLKEDPTTVPNHQSALKQAEAAEKAGDMKTAQAIRRAIGD